MHKTGRKGKGNSIVSIKRGFAFNMVYNNDHTVIVLDHHNNNGKVSRKVYKNIYEALTEISKHDITFSELFKDIKLGIEIPALLSLIKKLRSGIVTCDDIIMRFVHDAVIKDFECIERRLPIHEIDKWMLSNNI